MVHSLTRANLSVYSCICVSTSSFVIPQIPANSGYMEIFVKLLSSLKMLSCENFVMPVRKTNCKYGSEAFSGECITLRSTGKFCSSWTTSSSGASYSSMSMTTFLPVFLYAACINAVKRSLLSVAGLVMPYFFSYSARRLPRYRSS